MGTTKKDKNQRNVIIIRQIDTYIILSINLKQFVVALPGVFLSHILADFFY